MLLLGSRLIGTPVMSLQTGTRLAHISAPLIDPSNLKIIAYVVDGPLLDEHPSILRLADVREVGEVGMIIDSSDEFIGLNDVIKIKELHNLNFTLVGMTVTDQARRKLGKVEDYSVDTDTFKVEKLHVKRGFIKSLSQTSLLIHRSQIIEINNQSIIVRAAADKIQPVTVAERREYTNPFRSQSPQPDTTDA